ncbi:MAG: OsmC family protein [Candidatus Jordarchaeales archaeon]|nr:OsmC family protein [Candidatus Jordarchaeia archaeon]
MKRGKSKFFEVELNWIKNFLFEVTVNGFPKFHMDELEPVGEDSAPNPADYLLVSVGGCVASSFIYSTLKHGIPLKKLQIKVRGKYTRKKGMIRVGEVNVELQVDLADESTAKNLESCLNVFRKYCIISESLREGIPINIFLKIGKRVLEILPYEENDD